MDLPCTSRYAGALPEAPIPHRQNKRMLRVKPHFVLSSKPEIVRKMKAKEDKEAEVKAKQERFLIREEKKNSIQFHDNDLSL